MKAGESSHAWTYRVNLLILQYLYIYHENECIIVFRIKAEAFDSNAVPIKDNFARDAISDIKKKAQDQLKVVTVWCVVHFYLLQGGHFLSAIVCLSVNSTQKNYEQVLTKIS